MANNPSLKNNIILDVFVEGKKELTEAFSHDTKEITIGRSPDADITIKDTFVSKNHCAIRFSPKATMMEDLGSRNGTFVNGRKTASIEVVSGDKIQLGKTTIVVTLPEAVSSFEGETGEIEYQDTGEYAADEVEGATVAEGAKTVADEIIARSDIASRKKLSKKKRKGKAKDFDAAETLPSLDASQFSDSEDPTLKEYEEYYDDDDDEEDDEAGIVEYYSLIPKLIKSKEGYSSSRAVQKEERVEVITCLGDDILSIDELERGNKKKIVLGDKKVRFLSYNKPGECQVYLKEAYRGKFYSDGRSVPLSTALGSATGVRGSLYKYPVRSGDVGEIQVDARKYYIRFVQAPMLPDKIRDEEERKHIFNTLGSSVALHFIVFIIFSAYTMFISASDAITNAREQMDQFVKIDLKDLEKKPEPTPTPQPTVVSTPAPTPKITPKRIKVKRKRVRTRQKQPKAVGVRKSRRTKPGGGSGNVNVAATGVLASLGGLTTNTRSSSNVVKAVSNLDAVKAPKGTRSNFSVSGLIEKSAHGDAKIVRISGPNTKGVGGIDKQFGAIGTLGGRRGKGVGGVVVGDLPMFQDMRVKGSLSRAQIKKVVDKYVGEISYCYEKALFDNPGLEGKINMFWEIAGTGRVGMVRVKRSTLKSTQVHNCVKGIVKKMRFPKPKGGGIVQVGFPFKFSAASF